MLGRIRDIISDIPNKIKEIASNLADFNKSVGGWFSDLFENIKNKIDDNWNNNLKPAFSNIGDWFCTLGDNIGNFFSDLGNNLKQWFKDIGDGISSLGEKIGGWFSDLWNSVKDIFNWLGNFFNNLLDFCIHIFVPTDEQWSSIKNSYKVIGDDFKSHLPFVNFFTSEVEKAKESVYNNDFLNLHFSGWSFNLGVVHFSTPDIDFTQVRDTYEKFRLTIRTSLCYVLYAITITFIIKLVLRYGKTSSVSDNSTKSDKDGGK